MLQVGGKALLIYIYMLWLNVIALKSHQVALLIFIIWPGLFRPLFFYFHPRIKESVKSLSQKFQLLLKLDIRQKCTE